MTEKGVTFRILRYSPGRIDPPDYQDFHISLEPSMTVLDGLDSIRLNQDPSLIYRHCCHHASCGTCACTINGSPSLACTTMVGDIADDPIVLSPLEGQRCIGDLAVDNIAMFSAIDPQWAAIRDSETSSADRIPHGVDRITRLENCIECGCCVSACPVMPAEEPFLGPAVLAAVNNERRNRPDSAAELLSMAARPDGVSRCRRHIACSRVCPSKVYPARQISDLQRALASKTDSS